MLVQTVGASEQEYKKNPETFAAAVSLGVSETQAASSPILGEKLSRETDS